MSISKAERLVDAIGFFNQLHDPLSLAYKIKNPLLCKSFGRPGKHEITEDGTRIFDSLISGYRAAIFDMEQKLSGSSRSGLRDGALLSNLLGVYGLKDAGAAVVVCKFLRKCFDDPNISANTPLTYFREN